MKIASIGSARAAIVEHQGKTFYFMFNGLAMFALEDTFGGKEYLEKLRENTAEGLSALLQVSAILAEQGELARREMGYTPTELPTQSNFGIPALLHPIDILTLRNGCIGAINLGYTREISNEDEEIDLGLIELQKKRKPRGQII